MPQIGKHKPTAHKHKLKPTAHNDGWLNRASVRMMDELVSGSAMVRGLTMMNWVGGEKDDESMRMMDDGRTDWALKFGDGAWVGDGWTVRELRRWCVNFGGGGEEDDESAEVRVWRGDEREVRVWFVLRKGRSETAEKKSNRKKEITCVCVLGAGGRGQFF